MKLKRSLINQLRQLALLRGMQGFVVFCLSIVSCLAAGQTPTFDLGEGFSVTQAQIDEIARELPKLEQNKVYYHWAADDRAWRWIKQGYVDHGEVDFLNKPSGDRQTYGPGLYLAESATSSTSFGNSPVAFEMRKGTPLYKEEIVEKVLNRALSQEQIAKLGEKINFLRNVSGDWYTTNSAANTGHVSYGGRFEASEQDNKGIAHLYDVIGQLSRENNHQYGYLNSLSHLMNYQDGTTFVRSLQQKPHDPWSEFDPHNFENFKNTSQQVFSESAQGKNFGIANKGRFGQPGVDAKTWAEKQIALFQEMHNSILGRSQSSYRTAPVVGGGDQEGGHALVTEAQFHELETNPYLKIEGYRQKDPKYFDVKIHYPTLDNVERFQSLLSPEFYSHLHARGDLTKLSPEDRAGLTQDFLHDLLTERFKKAYQTPFDDRLYRDMIAIHPFDDGNGRTVRLLQRIGAADAGVKIPYFAISDLDLMTPSHVHNDLLVESNKGYEKWLGDLLAETQAANREHRLPQLVQYDHAARVGETLKGIGVQANWDHEVLHNIGLREWAPLLDKWIGPRWQELRSAPLETVMAQPAQFINDGLSEERLKAYVKNRLLSSRSDRMNAFSLNLNSHDKMFDRTLIQLLLEDPRNEINAPREPLWVMLSYHKTYSTLSEAERADFLRSSISLPTARAIAGDSEILKAIQSFSPSKTSINELRGIRTFIGDRTVSDASFTPELRAALNKILDVDLRKVSVDEARVYNDIFRTLDTRKLRDAAGTKFVQRNFTAMDEQTQRNLLSLLETKGSALEYRDLHKAVVSAGLKDFASKPDRFRSYQQFFSIVNHHPIDKRDFARLVQGLRAGTDLQVDAMMLLDSTDFSPTEVKLIDRELKRYIDSKRVPNDAFYMMIEKMHADQKGLGLTELAARAEIAAGRGPEFIKRTSIWTPSVSDDLLKHPDQYRGAAEQVIKSFAALHAPPEQVDEVLTALLKQNDAGTGRLVLDYAKSLAPNLTPHLDEEFSHRLGSILTSNGFVEYARTRPTLAEAVISSYEGLTDERSLASAALIAGDHPDLMAKAVKAIGAQVGKADPISHAFFLKFALHHPEALTLEQNAFIIANHGTAAQGSEFALKNAANLKQYLQAVRESTEPSAKWVNKTTLVQILASKNPSQEIKDVFTAEILKSRELETYLSRKFFELDQLEPWTRDLFKTILEKGSPAIRLEIAETLGSFLPVGKTARQLAEVYLESNVPDKVRVQARLTVQLRREKMGFPSESVVMRNRAAYEEALAQSIIKDHWSKEEVYALNDGQLEFGQVLKKALANAPIAEELKFSILKSNKSVVAHQDLLATLSRKSGKLGKEQIATWLRTNTCARPRPAFVEATRAMIENN